VIAVRSRGRRSFKHVGEPIALYELVFDRGDAPAALPVDPVCRMAIDPELATARVVYRGDEYHFCSDECARAFAAAPSRYVSAR
jgi:YHS domain-containing protein